MNNYTVKLASGETITIDKDQIHDLLENIKSNPEENSQVALTRALQNSGLVTLSEAKEIPEEELL